MAFLLKQGNRIDYSYKEYVLDSVTELSTLKVADCCPGSVAYVIADKTVYMLNNKKEWEVQ